jgi:hypothetical protein
MNLQLIKKLWRIALIAGGVVGLSVGSWDGAAAFGKSGVPDTVQIAERIAQVKGIQKTTAEITAELIIEQPVPISAFEEAEESEIDRSKVWSAPGAVAQAQWPGPATFVRESNARAQSVQTNSANQTVTTTFNTITGPTKIILPSIQLAPDTQGAVGPSQFVLFINGRLRTFTKAGVMDGVLDANPDVFFHSVSTPPQSGETVYTVDPQVRYDRLSKRWFLVMIDGILDSSGNFTRPNRVLIAVSDAASNGVISSGTVWTFYQFQGDATRYADYDSLGIDANALYIGANMGTLAPFTFTNSKVFVIPKAPALTGSPLTVWTFNNLVVGGEGPYAPRGVDNYDPSNTGPSALGYFIGVDFGSFNTLMIRRITNPGSLTSAPTISANIPVSTTLTTAKPIGVNHKGNTGGTTGRLNGQLDQLFAAHLRNGRLWTAQTIGADFNGVASGSPTRDAARWYEIQNLSTTPSVRQAGTLYDNTAPND